MPKNNEYTKTNLALDVILTLVTGGLWVIVIGIREIAKIVKS